MHSLTAKWYTLHIQRRGAIYTPMRKSKTTTRQATSVTNRLWAGILFSAIITGGAAVVLERRFELANPWLNAVIGVSVIIVVVSFLVFMTRLRD